MRPLCFDPDDAVGISALRYYSYLKASTGLRVAAFQLCQLTMSSVMPDASKPANCNC
ncbi:MAG: hypothetical protein RBU28_10670 [Bacteroidales bacterium]|nr:hypothetical protein [Bacteroidales bacterium]